MKGGALRIVFHTGFYPRLYAYAIGIKTPFLPVQVHECGICQDGFLSHRAIKECVSAVLVVSKRLQDRQRGQ